MTGAGAGSAGPPPVQPPVQPSQHEGIRRLYTLAWYLLLPLVFGYLLWRSLRQPAYREHWAERLGLAGGPSQAAQRPLPPIWIHAVSVGETRAALPLIEALARRNPQQGFLLTHTTPTGRETGAELARRFPGRIEQAYLPYDLPAAIERFLGRWQPACGLLIETEVWPNLAAVCARRRVPLALVNGRLSARSLARGKRQARLITPALRRLAAVVVQTADDAARVEQLGRRADAVCGNLKYDIQPSPARVAEGRRWRQRFGARPVVLAASTRDGEEALVVAAWQQHVGSGAVGPGGSAASAAPTASSVSTASSTSSPKPLLIVVPRHPQRFEEVGDALVAAFGIEAVARRADLDESDQQGSHPGNQRGNQQGSHLASPDRAARRARAAADDALLARADVLLGDSMGEMPAWYAATDVAIIGGSLLPFGAQNLIEANAVGCPVVLGPSTFNFAQAAEASIAAGAAVPVADAGEAVREALAIAANPLRRREMAAAALTFTAGHRGATARTIDALVKLLPLPGAAAG